MRFLHTADWHLGRPFHGESLLDAQAARVEHVVEVARAARGRRDPGLGRPLRPRAAAGRRRPPGRRGAGVGCSELAPGRRHLRQPRLGARGWASARACSRARACTCAPTRPRSARPVVLGGALRLRASRTWSPTSRARRWGARSAGTGRCWAPRWRRVRADLAQPPGGHAVVVDGARVRRRRARRASERDLAVGGAASVAASTFAGVDYVALGHLHGPQRIGARGALRRLAASPFSFSEAAPPQVASPSSTSAGAVPTSSWSAFPVARPLAMLRGTLDELLADPALADARARVGAGDAHRSRRGRADAMERLRRRFPHAVAARVRARRAPARAPEGSYAERLRGLDDARAARALRRATCAARRPRRTSWRCCATR